MAPDDHGPVWEKDPSRPPGRNGPLVIGVLSDTHGQLYPQVMRLLEGVDHIIHAGDVGSPEVLRALRTLAPVTAVRGNVDVGGWADALPSRAEVELGGVCVVVGHVAPRRDGAGRAGRPLVVVAGHSHVPLVEQREDGLYLNPGSAGPRRFGRPRTIARLEIQSPSEGKAGGRPDGVPRVTAEIITVDRD
jgi:putative phosphoesterase